MKIRYGFVSNSSSSSFIITNKTDHPLSMKEFVDEAEFVIEQYVRQYRFVMDGTDTIETTVEKIKSRMMKDARRERDIKPGENEFVFGDEQGTEIGRVFDYALRDGGSTSRFDWRFEESLR